MRSTNHTRNRIRNIWHQMRRRCYDPSADSYKYYGGKGVRICEQWNDDFNAFYDWSLSHGYESRLTIDRIDSSGNYEPSNCKWSTMKEQDNNRSNNIIIEYLGESHTIPEWSEILGIAQHVIRTRLDRGWSIEETMTRKVGKYGSQN